MSEESTTALLRGTLEYCVLALLAGQQMYSVELVHRVSAELNLSTSEGAMYPLLSRLRRAGRIAASWQESANGPPRRYYTVTPAGERALQDFRTQWTSFRSGVDRIMGTEQK